MGLETVQDTSTWKPLEVFLKDTYQYPMERRYDFTGLGVALVTPFDIDGEVDFAKLGMLADRLVTSGADYIVVMGTTAETPALTSREKADVRQAVAEAVYGRVPLVLGFGGNCTRELCSELRSWDGNGYDAILSVTPFYNKPSQQGLYEHFKAVAQASPLPVILYNVPGRTGVNMQAITTLRLANDVDGIVAIKEASGNMEQVAAIIAASPDDFSVISGDDGLTVEMVEKGGAGVISVIANAAPGLWSRLTHLALDGKIKEAKAIEEGLRPLLDMLFAEGNPSGIKALMGCMGLCENTLRLPLVRVSDNLSERMGTFVETYGSIR